MGERRCSSRRWRPTSERRQSASWVDARGADGRETPAASFTLVRVLGDAVEIARLGDCLVLLESKDGTVKALEHPVLEQIEAETRRAILELRVAGVTDPQQILRTMMPQLRTQRSRRNIADGYGVLAGERGLCVDDPSGSMAGAIAAARADERWLLPPG